MGIDPGMRNTGVALMSYSLAEGRKLLDLRLIRTKKGTKKLGMRAKSDDMRSLGEVIEQFDEVLRIWPPDILALEECPSIRQNATSTRKVALAWGAIYALATRTPGVLTFEFGPKALKSVATGSEGASKAEMIAAVSARHSEFEGFCAKHKITKSLQEHLADAVAACWKAAEEPAAMQLARACERAGA